MHTFSRRKNIVLWALSLYPVVWLALFYAFVLRARFHLGYWPSYSRPDPKDLDFTVHHLLLHFGLIGLPLVAIAAVSFGIALRVQTREIPIWRIILAGLLTVAVVVFLNVEPYDFMGWFLD